MSQLTGGFKTAVWSIQIWNSSWKSWVPHMVRARKGDRQPSLLWEPSPKVSIWGCIGAHSIGNKQILDAGSKLTSACATKGRFCSKSWKYVLLYFTLALFHVWHTYPGFLHLVKVKSLEFTHCHRFLENDLNNEKINYIHKVKWN